MLKCQFGFLLSKWKGKALECLTHGTPGTDTICQVCSFYQDNGGAQRMTGSCEVWRINYAKVSCTVCQECKIIWEQETFPPAPPWPGEERRGEDRVTSWRAWKGCPLHTIIVIYAKSSLPLGSSKKSLLSKIFPKYFISIQNFVI